MQSDEQEMTNIFQEKTLNDQIQDYIHTLKHTNATLKTTYKDIEKISKTIKKILHKKEKDNLKELTTEEHSQGKPIPDLQNTAKLLRAEEEKEKKLSYEEAKLLQKMLLKIQEAQETTKNMRSISENLHYILRDTYAKDLQDFELEVEDINKA